MATIKNLAMSITDLSADEGFRIIMAIRKSRLVKKVTKFSLKMDRAAKKGKSRVKKDPLKGVDNSTLIELLKEGL